MVLLYCCSCACSCPVIVLPGLCQQASRKSLGYHPDCEFALNRCCSASCPCWHHYAGVVYANKPHAEVLGVARLLDEQHRLEAVISFGPVPGTRQRMLARADAVCGEIYQLPRAAHLQVS
jgi:hypothetical protein